MMNDIETLLDYLVSFCCLICAIIGAFKSWRANKNALMIKKGVDTMRKEIKYRTENYQANEPDKVPTFSKYVKTYSLNDDTGFLEETGVIDVKELVNSSLDSSLSKILERFGFDATVESSALAMSAYADVPVSKEVGVARGMARDLDTLQQMSMDAEKLRKQYGLSDNLSLSEIYSKISELKTSVDSYVAGAQSQMKGVDIGEKANK